MAYVSRDRNTPQRSSAQRSSAQRSSTHGRVSADDALREPSRLTSERLPTYNESFAQEIVRSDTASSRDTLPPYNSVVGQTSTRESQRYNTQLATDNFHQAMLHLTEHGRNRDLPTDTRNSQGNRADERTSITPGPWGHATLAEDRSRNRNLSTGAGTGQRTRGLHNRLIDPFQTNEYRQNMLSEGDEGRAEFLRGSGGQPNVYERSIMQRHHLSEITGRSSDEMDRLRARQTPRDLRDPPPYKDSDLEAPYKKQGFIEKHVLHSKPKLMTRKEAWEYEQRLFNHDNLIRGTYGYPYGISHWEINKREKVKEQQGKKLKTEIKLLEEWEIKMLERAQKAIEEGDYGKPEFYEW
ncbi:MAG: hypothetical protein Q9220_000633 [cf. Caloplaca sp. 1 TL-2023]